MQTGQRLRCYTARNLFSRRGWLGALGLVALLFGCGRGKGSPTYNAQITTTSWGVPHIKANDFAGLGYGVGYSYAKDNFCLMAEYVVTVNGERSKYAGPDGTAVIEGSLVDNLTADTFMKSYLDDAALKKGYDAAPNEVRDLIRGYVAGYNRYLYEPDPGNATCKGQSYVRPIAEADVYRMVAEKAILNSGGVFINFMGAQPPAPAVVGASATGVVPDPAAIRRALRINDRPLGSNAYALGKSVTGSSTGMLMGNPHFPWISTNRFYNMQMTIPGTIDVMGASIAGLPVVVIGFNKDVAWSHTVSAASRYTLYELTLDPKDPTSYIYDGQSRKMTTKQVSIQARQTDGSLTTVTRKIFSSHYGPIIAIPQAGLVWSTSRAYAVRDCNINNTRLLEQWLRISKAGSVAEIRTALNDVTGLPWVNTIAADRTGNTLYADIGSAPNVSQALSDSCIRSPLAKALLENGIFMLDGSTSSCEWGNDPGAPEPGLFAASSMPFLFRDDYVANSNDSYWLSNPNMPLTGYSPIFGLAGTQRSLRTRLGLMQIQQRLDGTDGLPGNSFNNLSTLEAVLFSNRILGAELTVDALVAACKAQPSIRLETGETIDLTQAASILEAWDKKANLDSVGTVLFREFWLRASTIPTVWQVPFDPVNPVQTPNTLNTQDPGTRQALLQQLGVAVKLFNNLGIDFRKPLGQLQYVVRNGKNIPMHGSSGFEGAFNVMEMFGPMAGGYPEAVFGASYIQMVTWDANGPVADGMLAYSQSTDPANQYFADQTKNLYSNKKFAKQPFTDVQIKEDPNAQTYNISE